MGRVAKGVSCSVEGCGAVAKRSISRVQLAEVFEVSGDSRRVYLCDEHYKVWKKATRKQRELEKARFG